MGGGWEFLKHLLVLFTISNNDGLNGPLVWKFLCSFGPKSTFRRVWNSVDFSGSCVSISKGRNFCLFFLLLSLEPDRFLATLNSCYFMIRYPASNLQRASDWTDVGVFLRVRLYYSCLLLTHHNEAILNHWQLVWVLEIFSVHWNEPICFIQLALTIHWTCNLLF